MSDNRSLERILPSTSSPSQDTEPATENATEEVTEVKAASGASVFYPDATESDSSPSDEKPSDPDATESDSSEPPLSRPISSDTTLSASSRRSGSTMDWETDAMVREALINAPYSATGTHIRNKVVHEGNRRLKLVGEAIVMLVFRSKYYNQEKSGDEMLIATGCQLAWRNLARCMRMFEIHDHITVPDGEEVTDRYMADTMLAMLGASFEVGNQDLRAVEETMRQVEMLGDEYEAPADATGFRDPNEMF